MVSLRPTRTKGEAYGIHDVINDRAISDFALNQKRSNKMQMVKEFDVVLMTHPGIILSDTTDSSYLTEV